MSDQPRMTIRQVQMEWPPNLPKYWHRENPFATHYFNALSLIFPDGEKFFVDSIRHHMGSLEDSVGSEIRHFIGQEIWHSKAHADFNAYLESQKLPVQKCEDRLKSHLKKWKANHTHIEWLAATVAYEHITASMSRELLLRQDNCKNMHPHFAVLWRWHTMEELEHKNVAFDLYQRESGDYWLRVRMMLYVLWRFNWDATMNLFDLLKADGQMWKLKTWVDCVRLLYGKKHGWFWKTLPDVFSFFRPGFHPDQIDDSKLLAETLELFEKDRESRKFLAA